MGVWGSRGTGCEDDSEQCQKAVMNKGRAHLNSYEERGSGLILQYYNGLDDSLRAIDQLYKRAGVVFLRFEIYAQEQWG